MNMQKYDAIIIGGGIIGTSIALRLAELNKKILLLEKNSQPYGASIRNFGMIWPIGHSGNNYQLAMESSRQWARYALKAGFWIANKGSLLLAKNAEEGAVLEELISMNAGSTDLKLLNKSQVEHISPIANTDHLQNALFSTSECNVNPREALHKLHEYLKSFKNVSIRYKTLVNYMDDRNVFTNENQWEAENIFVCTGHEIQHLNPGWYQNHPREVCKTQMMRSYPLKLNDDPGPTICGGLSLLQYERFKLCKSLAGLENKMEQELSDFLKYGIHVSVSFTEEMQLNIGESHELGTDHNPFINNEINNLILKYLGTLINYKDLKIAEYWFGEYLKIENENLLIEEKEDNIYIVNAPGGSGMTLCFGIADQVINMVYNYKNQGMVLN